MYRVPKRKPRNVIYLEILEFLRIVNRKVEVSEIVRRTRFTERQVYDALHNRLKSRSLVDVDPPEKLKPSRGKPPLGKIKIAIRRDKKTGNISKTVDLVLNRYKRYKTKHKLW